MKRLIIILILCLFVLSSCGPTYNELIELNEELDMKVFELEENNAILENDLEELQIAIGHLETDANIVNNYFENEYNVSFDEARESFHNIMTVISSYY